PTLGERVKSLRLGDRETPQAPRSRYLPWFLVIALTFVCVAFGYRAYRVGNYDPEAARERREPKALAKRTEGTTPAPSPAPPSPPVGEVVVKSKGYVVPIRLIQVSPWVGGQLIRINESFEEGRVFKQGEFLAEIDPKEYRYLRDQAQATHLAAQKRYEELK